MDATNLSNIIVPLDGSARSEEALPLAAEIARRFSARLTLLRVGQRPEIASLGEARELSGLLDEIESRCRTYLDEVKHKLASPDLEVATEYVMGVASQCLVERSQQPDCSMIVMSTHGRDGLSRWLIGSVAEKVTRHASCPVTLIRSTKD